jgi:hypothetical protein
VAIRAQGSIAEPMACESKLVVLARAWLGQLRLIEIWKSPGINDSGMAVTKRGKLEYFCGSSAITDAAHASRRRGAISCNAVNSAVFIDRHLACLKVRAKKTSGFTEVVFRGTSRNPPALRRSGNYFFKPSIHAWILTWSPA